MPTPPISSTNSASALSALAPNFQSLLQIILTQLQYQDPLKPLDNFEFVSQLAQFTSLEQGQQLNTQITNLLQVQSSAQATGLLGHTVDVQQPSGQVFTGTVKGISLSTGTPQLTVTSSSGQTLTNVTLTEITQVS